MEFTMLEIEQIIGRQVLNQANLEKVIAGLQAELKALKEPEKPKLEVVE